ncbi:hypothetical protein [Listeria grandensis]
MNAIANVVNIQYNDTLFRSYLFITNNVNLFCAILVFIVSSPK